MISDDVHLSATALAAGSRAVDAASDVEDMTAALVSLAESLRTAGEACDALAAHIVPDAISGSICDRYRAAAEAWPASSRPSYERLAAVLSHLHDTATATRSAARRADGAARALAAAHCPRPARPVRV